MCGESSGSEYQAVEVDRRADATKEQYTTGREKGARGTYKRQGR